MSTPRFTKSLSLVLIRLVLTEIQAFKNVKDLQRNVWKCGQIRTICLTEIQAFKNVRNLQRSVWKCGQILVRICPHFQTFLCKFFTFLNACISVKTSLINTKLGDFVNLGVLFLTMWINSCQSHNLQTCT